MILNSPYITGSITVTGNANVQGTLTVTGSLSGTATSASLALNSNLLQGTGSVGFSTTASLLEVSSSQQQISASLLNVIANYATTGSNSFRADQSITGSLVVSSTITAQTLVVQTVTSSIVYSSGSNLFGSALTDRQTFTGSVNITGSLTVNTTGTEFQVTNRGVVMGNLLTDTHSITGSLSVTGSQIVFGNVGIGTTNPGQKIQVRGTNENAIVRVETTGSGNPSVTFTTLGQQDWGIGVDFTDSGKLKFDGATTVGASTKMTLTSAGNLGLGTTIPNGKLDVYVGSYQNLIFKGESANQSSLRFNESTNGPRLYSDAGTEEFRMQQSYTGTGFLSFYTGPTEKMRITKDGYVGIGITANTILGVSAASNNSTTAVEGLVRLYNTYDGGVATIGFSSNSGGNQDGRAGIAAGKDPASGTTGFLAFSVRKDSSTFAEAMRITSTSAVVAGDTSAVPSGTNNAAHLWVPSQKRMYISADSACATFCRTAVGGSGQIVGFDYNGGSAGNISTNGSTVTFSGTAVSDARYKEDIQPITNALEAINQVDFVTFKFKENGHNSAGVTSQQIQTIEKLAPFVIDGVEEEFYKAFDYNALVGYLGKAIQELKATNDDLQAQINELKSR